MKTDLVDLETNLVPIKKVVVGVSAQSLLSKSKASDLQIMSFRTSCHKFLIAAIQKVLERSPLKYKSTKAISCLNPSTTVQPVSYVWVISCIYTNWIELTLKLQTVPKSSLPASVLMFSLYTEKSFCNLPEKSVLTSFTLIF